MRDYAGWIAVTGIWLWVIVNFVYLLPLKIYEIFVIIKKLVAKCKKSKKIKDKK
jgi:hypothetical protein